MATLRTGPACPRSTISFAPGRRRGPGGGGPETMSDHSRVLPPVGGRAPPLVSHRRAVWSAEAEAAPGAGWGARVAGGVCPRRLFCAREPSASTCTLLGGGSRSLQRAATTFPSRLMATAHTRSSWPLSVCRSVPGGGALGVWPRGPCDWWTRNEWAGYSQKGNQEPQWGKGRHTAVRINMRHQKLRSVTNTKRIGRGLVLVKEARPP